LSHAFPVHRIAVPKFGLNVMSPTIARIRPSGGQSVAPLLRTELGQRVELRALKPDERLYAPHMLDLEIDQVLRRLTHLKEVTVARAHGALDAPLFTCDGKLARSHGHRAAIELLQ
jgi:predicted nucleic acid-binding protein